MSEVVRLAMWSGPRNLSTAMMRSFENRSDCAVMDEPLYAHYLARTGLDHPMRPEILASQPTEEAEAIATCLAHPPDGATLSYQKHMSHHLLPDMDRSWLDELRHVLLIRHPARVLTSYLDKRDEVTLEDLGLPQQVELAERCALIIDADRFLAAPGDHLATICAVVDRQLEPGMLQWPAGPRPSDGVWASHWYDSVWSSTGFGPDHQRPIPATPEGRDDLAAAAAEIYDRLLAEAWAPDPRRK